MEASMRSFLQPEVLTSPDNQDRVLAMTAVDSLRAGADSGGSLAVWGEGEMTVREMVDVAESRGRGLVHAGLEPGARVVVCLPPSTDLVIWAWAIAFAGGSVVMISSRAGESELRKYAKISGARRVITHYPGDDFIDPDTAERLFRTRADVTLPTVTPDDEAICFATSGSTGSSKLASFTNRTFPAQFISYQHMIGGAADETIVFPQPLAHVAYTPQVHFPLVQGRRLVVLPKFNAKVVIEAAIDERAAVINGTPSTWRLILDQVSLPDSRLVVRRVSYAAAPMPARWAEQLAEAMNCEIVHAYGLTEAGGVMTTLPPDKIISKAGSAGAMLAPQHGMVVIEPDTESILDNGAIGEICFRGPAATTGYIGQPEQTAELWRHGWLHTGDLGYVDDDGDLWITGRLKEQISRGGLKIGAREVETVIESLDGVTGVGVAGYPDPVLGERVGAIVEVRDSSFDAATVRSVASAQLADYKVPDRVIIVDEIPRNAMAKIDKPTVRKMLENYHDQS
jgi:acyl-CoA synthetase (AMP-forming)/AMP-acid ligase II